jgi:outer membrane usher protein
MFYKKTNILRVISGFVISVTIAPLAVYASDTSKPMTFSRGFMKYYDSGIDLTQFDGVEKILPGNIRLRFTATSSRLIPGPLPLWLQIMSRDSTPA